MVPDLILRLEEKIDLLLMRNRLLEEETSRLRAEIVRFSSERERMKEELDRILAKLENIGGGGA